MEARAKERRFEENWNRRWRGRRRRRRETAQSLVARRWRRRRRRWEEQLCEHPTCVAERHIRSSRFILLGGCELFVDYFRVQFWLWKKKQYSAACQLRPQPFGIFGEGKMIVVTWCCALQVKTKHVLEIACRPQPIDMQWFQHLSEVKTLCCWDLPAHVTKKHQHLWYHYPNWANFSHRYRGLLKSFRSIGAFSQQLSNILKFIWPEKICFVSKKLFFKQTQFPPKKMVKVHVYWIHQNGRKMQKLHQ